MDLLNLFGRLFRKEGRAGQITVGLWALLPVLGTITPFLYLSLVPFNWDRGRRLHRMIGTFAGLCTAYFIYMSLRMMWAGPPETWGEPLEDMVPVLLTVLIAFWSIRTIPAFKFDKVFQAMTCASLLVVAGVAYQKYVLNDWGPALLLGNTLNLTPLLLVPALLCTMGEWAPTRLWRVFGLMAFCLSLVTMASVAQTRGPFLVLSTLAFLRILSGLIGPAPWRARLWRVLPILVAYILALGLIFGNSQAVERLFSLAVNAQTEPPAYTPSVQPDPVTPWITDPAHSIYIRALMLQAGLAAIHEAPVWGYGPQFRVDAAAAYFPTGTTSKFSHLHNEFITHAVAGGIPAVAFLIAILMFPLFAAWQFQTHKRARREFAAIFTIAFTGTAALNNVLFVPIWGFMLPLSIIASLILLHAFDQQSN